MLSDRLIIKIAREIDRRISRRNYEDVLVGLGMYSLFTLRDNDEYHKLSKGDLIIETLRSDKYELRILSSLFSKGLLSKDLIRELNEYGINLGEESE